MKKRLLSLGLVFLVVLSLFAFAENQPPSVQPSSPCTGFWGSLSCFLFGNPENRAGRSWFDRGNVAGEAVDSSGNDASPQNGNGFEVTTADGTVIYIRYDGDNWHKYDVSGRILAFDVADSISAPEDRQDAYNNQVTLAYWQQRETTASRFRYVPILTFANYEDIVYAPLSPTDKYEYRIVDGHLEARQSGTSGRWLNLADPADCNPSDCNREQAERNFAEKHPGILAQSAAASSSPSSTASSTTASAPSRPTPAQETEARARMGESIFNKYKDQIDWSASTLAQGTYTLSEELGTITVNQQVGYNIVTVNVKNIREPTHPQDTDNSRTAIVVAGSEVISQSLAQQPSHQATIPDGEDSRTVFLRSGDNLEEVATATNGIYYYATAEDSQRRGGRPQGRIAVSAAEHTITTTDFSAETQTIRNTATGGTTRLDGDYYRENDEGEEFIPGSGTEFDAHGRKLRLLDYDYEETGSDRRVDQATIEVFDASNGKRRELRLPDGTSIDAQYNEQEGYYDGSARISRPDTENFVRVRRDDSGAWNLVESPQAIITELTPALTQIANDANDEQPTLPPGTTIVPELGPAGGPTGNYRVTTGDSSFVVTIRNAGAIADAQRRRAAATTDAERNQIVIPDPVWGVENELNPDLSELTPHLDDVRDTTVGFAAQAQTTLLSIYAFTQSVKDYPALSNLFYGNQDWYKSQQRTFDQFFAPMLGSNWFPSAFCEGNYDIEPAGTAVIKTTSGTYQASAHIEMERSERKSPMLCERNQDPEAEQEWRCSRGQVCVDGNFCYLDANNDGAADQDTPLEGYFYKITWGVTAPSDEAFTPFRDENGVAVSFNVWLDTAANGFKDAGALPLYNKDGSTLDPIELKNGGRDSDVYIHYSPNLLTEACIHWGKAPATTRSFSGTRTIGEVCFEVDVSSVGEVNWGRSGRQAPSPTVSGGQVSRNSDW